MPVNAYDRALKEIIADLSDRRGLRQEWEQIDPATIVGIKTVWREILSRHLLPRNGGKPAASKRQRPVTLVDLARLFAEAWSEYNGYLRGLSGLTLSKNPGEATLLLLEVLEHAAVRVLDESVVDKKGPHV